MPIEQFIRPLTLESLRFKHVTIALGDDESALSYTAPIERIMSATELFVKMSAQSLLYSHARMCSGLRVIATFHDGMRYEASLSFVNQDSTTELKLSLSGMLPAFSLTQPLMLT